MDTLWELIPSILIVAIIDRIGWFIKSRYYDEPLL
jgi:hypothetical protein